jgi:alpha-D-xyloside xylohydrolase
MGATVFKTDMGEAIPEDAVFFDGTTGRTTHNVYSLYYNKAAFETASAYSPETAIVWCRSAWAGSQRYPVHWGGDPTCRFEDMSTELWGGFGLGLSGFAYWSHDIGGTIGSPTPDLYIRWAQFGLLCSHSRAHGSTPREPWEYGDNILRIFKEFVALRYRLIPYLYSLSHTAHQTGLPLLRAMVLEFQDDFAVRNFGSQYMFGPSLLVAPVMDESNRREVYLPQGNWLDWWTKEIHQGPKILSMEIPLEKIPLFLRQGSILPLGEVTQWVGEHPQSRLELHLFIKEHASFTIYDEDDHPWQFHAQKTENQLAIDLPDSRFQITLVLYGEKPKKIMVDEVTLPADLLQGTQVNTWIVNVPARSNQIIAVYS